MSRIIAHLIPRGKRRPRESRESADEGEMAQWHHRKSVEEQCERRQLAAGAERKDRWDDESRVASLRLGTRDAFLHDLGIHLPTHVSVHASEAIF